MRGSGFGITYCMVFLPLLLIAIPTSVSLAQNLHDIDWEWALTTGMMSQVAYHEDIQETHRMEESLQDQGWRWNAPYRDKSGLSLTRFERYLPNGKREIVIGFAGTESFRDGQEDIAQINPFRLIPPKQYRTALSEANKVVMEADRDPNLTVRFTGHSLGGGLAQYVSIKTGVSSFVFNSAPLGRSTQFDWPDIAKYKGINAASNIKNIRTFGDAVSASGNITGADQHGVRVVLNAPSNVPRANQFGWKDTAGLHSMTYIIEGIKSKDVYSIESGPITSSATSRVPGLWVTNQVGRIASDMSTKMELLRKAGEVAGRTVVVGDNEHADHLYKHMTDSLGQNNVLYLPESNNIQVIQKKAAEYSADMILGVMNYEPNFIDDSQMIVVDRKSAELFASTVHALSTAIRELNIHDKSNAPTFRKVIGPSSKGMLDALGTTQDLYDIGLSVERDISLIKQRKISVIRSNVLHTLTEKVLDKGYDKTFNAICKSLEARGVIKAADYPDFGAKELFKGAYTHAKSGKPDIDTITHYCDAVNNLAWGMLGLVASGGNVKMAKTYQVTGNATAKIARMSTEEVFTVGFSRHRTQHLTMLENYRTECESRAARNIDLLSIEQYAGSHEIIKRSGLKAADIEIANQIYLSSQMEQIKKHPVPTFSACSTEVDVGNEGNSDVLAAIRLAASSKKVVIFGAGDVAVRTYQVMTRSLGVGNVKLVRSDPGRLERQRMAREFGATSIVSVSRQSYREVTRAGYAHRVDISDDKLKYPSRRIDPFTQQDTSPWYGDIPPTLPVGADVKLPTRSDLNSTSSHNSLPSLGVGGVLLEGAAHIDGDESNIGADNFSLIFENAFGEVDVRALRMFITALWAVYFSNEGPGISIDPIAKGVDKHLVRYIGQVINLDLGRVMREADYLMKSWAVGSERARIDGFKNPEDFAADRGVMHIGAASRFWFVPEDIQFTKANNMLLFKDGTMILRTEYLSHNSGVGACPENEDFANYFTNHYWDLALAYPIFQELFEYAKYVSLARYLKQQGVPLLGYLIANRDLIITENAPGVVDAFARKSDIFEEVEIEGGVDLSMHKSTTNYVFDDKTLQALEIALMKYYQEYDQPMGRLAIPNQMYALEEALDQFDMIPAEQLSLSSSGMTGDIYQTDCFLRLLGESRFELARYYNEEHEGVRTFGKGWHLLIPLEVQPACDEKINYQNAVIPARMKLINRLTGEAEILTFCTTTYTIAGYVPDNPEESVNIGLFLLSDATFRLADKLGSEYQFDEAGRLVEMMLTDNYNVSFKYGYKSFSWREFEAAPYKLVTDGDQQESVYDITLPSAINLVSTTGVKKRFVLSADNRYGRLGYIPESDYDTDYKFIALLRNGSFLLEDQVGNQYQFNSGGNFTHYNQVVVERMTQNDFQAKIEYQFDGSDSRINYIYINPNIDGAQKYAISYLYGKGGLLTNICDATGMTSEIIYESGGVISTAR